MRVGKSFVFYCLVFLLITISFTAAVAWVPDDVYETTDALPSSVCAQLPPEQTYILGLRGGTTIFVLTSIDADTRQIRIFDGNTAQDRTESSAYTLACISAPLPKWHDTNASIGCSGGNALYLVYDGGGTYFNFFPNADGRWLLGSIQAKEVIGFTMTGVRDYETDQAIYGKLEFDLAAMDASTLPGTFAEAWAMVDTNGYGMVKSEVSTDRLDLRVSPSKDAESIGKYYSGTPVQVLSEEGDWCKVSVFGIEGYFKRACLAFDRSMLDVPRFFPGKFIREEYTGLGIPVYMQPDTTADMAGTLDNHYSGWSEMTILGAVGDDWFHVVSDAGVAGYVESKYCWDGNG